MNSKPSNPVDKHAEIHLRRGVDRLPQAELCMSNKSNEQESNPEGLAPRGLRAPAIAYEEVARAMTLRMRIKVSRPSVSFLSSTLLVRTTSRPLDEAVALRVKIKYSPETSSPWRRRPAVVSVSATTCT